MNVLFLVVFIVCTALICVRDPSAFLPALLSGAERAVSLCITLAAVYAVWLGILQVAEDAGALRGLARGMKPLTKKIFRTENEGALGKIAVNLSANLLGMGGAATPAGISAMRLLGAEENARYSRAMLFAVNCAGLQLFPTTVVSLRAASGAASAYDVVLPILLSSLCALIMGVSLVMLLCGRGVRMGRAGTHKEGSDNGGSVRADKKGGRTERCDMRAGGRKGVRR